MHSIISGTVTGIGTLAATVGAQVVTGDNSPVTIGLAVGAAFIVFYTTREFTKLRDDVNVLLQDKKRRDKEDKT